MNNLLLVWSVKCRGVIIPDSKYYIRYHFWRCIVVQNFNKIIWIPGCLTKLCGFNWTFLINRVKLITANNIRLYHSTILYVLLISCTLCIVWFNGIILAYGKMKKKLTSLLIQLNHGSKFLVSRSCWNNSDWPHLDLSKLSQNSAICYCKKRQLVFWWISTGNYMFKVNNGNSRSECEYVQS